jgi:hypothetical protein
MVIAVGPASDHVGPLRYKPVWWAVRPIVHGELAAGQKSGVKPPHSKFIVSTFVQPEELTRTTIPYGAALRHLDGRGVWSRYCSFTSPLKKAGALPAAGALV